MFKSTEALLRVQLIVSVGQTCNICSGDSNSDVLCVFCSARTGHIGTVPTRKEKLPPPLAVAP